LPCTHWKQALLSRSGIRMETALTREPVAEGEGMKGGGDPVPGKEADRP